MTAQRINHPMANEISIIDHSMAMATQGVSSELAFFLNGRWVIKPIPEFAEYAEYSTGDTRVYGWVPNELIEAFMETYRA